MATPKNQSVVKAFTMLQSFRHPDEWVTSSELSRRAGLPEASGYRLIQTLEEIGAVLRGERGRYRPGLLLVSLSQNVAIADCLREAARAIMADLSQRHNVTAHLGILEAGMVTYVAKVATASSLVTHTKPGAQLEAYSTGLGKVLLAALPQEELDNFVLEGALVPLTPHTITDTAALFAELERTRQRGYAVDDRESRMDMCCIAVPIRDNDGRTIAAMSVTERASEMTPGRQEQLRASLFEAAAALKRKMYPAAPRIEQRRAVRQRVI
jgi:DNA-binding IclR family transcriptional regulator